MGRQRGESSHGDRRQREGQQRPRSELGRVTLLACHPSTQGDAKIRKVKRSPSAT